MELVEVVVLGPVDVDADMARRGNMTIPKANLEHVDTRGEGRLEEAGAPKVEAAIGGVLQKKRGRPRKEEGGAEEFVSQRRRRFGIKKHQGAPFGTLWRRL